MTTYRTPARAARLAASDGSVRAPKRGVLCVPGWNGVARISAHPTAA